MMHHFTTFAQCRCNFLLPLLAHFHTLTEIATFQPNSLCRYLALRVNKSAMLA